MKNTSLGGFVCIASAVGLALVSARCGREADASEKLVRVEAEFSRAGGRLQTGANGSSYERMVDAVFRLDGKTYRHNVSETQAKRIVPNLPGRGVLLIDPRDPANPPRRSPPVGVAGLPLLAALLSALAGIALFIASRRQDPEEEPPSSR